MNTQTFNYRGKEVEFSIQGEEVLVNATEMGKVFGKRPIDFLRLSSTKEYILELKTAFTEFRSENYSLLNSVNEVSTTENQLKKAENALLNPLEIVKTEKGKGEDGGVTWMHSRLALKFATWLDVKFEIWVYEVINKITFGNLVEVNKDIEHKANLLIRKGQLERELINVPKFGDYLLVLDDIKKTSNKIGRGQNNQLNMFQDYKTRTNG